MSASLLRPDFCVNKVPDKGQFEIALFCYPDGVTVVMKNGYFEFLTHFVDLTDPREERGRNHLLMDMVGMTLCGTICGANTWADIERFCVAHQDWFSEFLELPNGVPSHDTFGRVFRVLDTQQ